MAGEATLFPLACAVVRRLVLPSGGGQCHHHQPDGREQERRGHQPLTGGHQGGVAAGTTCQSALLVFVTLQGAGPVGRPVWRGRQPGPRYHGGSCHGASTTHVNSVPAPPGTSNEFSEFLRKRAIMPRRFCFITVTRAGGVYGIRRYHHARAILDPQRHAEVFVPIRVAGQPGHERSGGSTPDGGTS